MNKKKQVLEKSQELINSETLSVQLVSRICLIDKLSFVGCISDSVMHHSYFYHDCLVYDALFIHPTLATLAHSMFIRETTILKQPIFKSYVIFTDFLTSVRKTAISTATIIDRIILHQ